MSESGQPCASPEGASDLEQRRSYLFGAAAIISASLFTSLAGILVRLVEEADGWTLLFYRQAFFVAFILAYCGLRYGRGFPGVVKQTGWPGVIAALALGLAFSFYIQALIHTSVAKVVFIGSTSPFWAALIAWLVLREGIRRTTVLAMVIALSGVALMAQDAFNSGQNLGLFYAFIPTLGYAVTLTCMRARKNSDMLPAVALAGAFGMLLGFFLADSLSITSWDLLMAALLGIVQVGFQYILVAYGARHVPAGEVALLGRLQLVLAPLWVWIWIGEQPSVATLIGGAVVVSAVLFYSYMTLRRPREPQGRGVGAPT